MAEQTLDIDSVIAAYEAQIAAIQEAIAALRKAKDSLGAVGIASAVSGRPRESVDVEPGAFFRMSVADAAKRYLGMCTRRAQTVEEIQDALHRGGLDVSKESLFTILPRAAKGREIVKVGRGLWGLAERFEADKPRPEKRPPAPKKATKRKPAPREAKVKAAPRKASRPASPESITEQPKRRPGRPRKMEASAPSVPAAATA